MSDKTHLSLQIKKITAGVHTFFAHPLLLYVEYRTDDGVVIVVHSIDVQLYLYSVQLYIVKMYCLICIRLQSEYELMNPCICCEFRME